MANLCNYGENRRAQAMVIIAYFQKMDNAWTKFDVLRGQMRVLDNVARRALRDFVMAGILEKRRRLNHNVDGRYVWISEYRLSEAANG